MAEPQIMFDFDPRNAPPEVLQAIGLVAMAAAQTESVMQQLIGSLLGIDNIQTIALGAHMSAPLKDHVARTLAELAAPTLQELDEFDELMDTVNSAMGKRNVIVHNALAIDPSGKVFSLRESARGSLQVTLKPFDVDEARKDAALIYDAGMAVVTFMLRKGLTPTDRKKAVRTSPKRGEKARKARRDSGYPNVTK
jgi:hypothetical protein